MDHLDIKGAFLHAPMTESDDVCLKLPSVPGVPYASETVFKLWKSLYGLPQPRRLWYKMLAKTIKRIGLRRAKSTDSLFTSDDPDRPVLLLVYVYYVLVVGDRRALKDVEDLIAGLFTTTDLGSCT